MLKAQVTVEVWITGTESRQEVTVILDDEFSLEQLSVAGSALQRGCYDAMERAIVELLEELEKQDDI